MRVMMLAYSALLTVGLVLSAPWWLLRMATTQRYREGLRERLGVVPAALRGFVAGKKIVWVHAVSVGEVLAVSRLVAELEAALGEGWGVVVSTTTRTGQALARERFGAERVFYYPLDFAFAVRVYLRVLKPTVLVLAESEVWPRMLHEARKLGVPVAVVNARVSDRSFARGMKVRRVWSRVLRMPALWMAQSDEDAGRLVAMGVLAENVRAIGNLKYDVRAVEISPIAKRIGQLRGASRVYVAGSTVDGEEELLLAAWPQVLRGAPDLILVLAPRHPERFARVREMVLGCGYELILGSQILSFAGPLKGGMIVLLDTIGDLATVYSVAHGAFVGGSLVPKGGHNPLEAARFGVPVMMGESYENFREIVEGMKDAWAIGITKRDELAWRIIGGPRYGQAWGQRGKEFADNQMGATGRAIGAIVAMTQEAKA